MLTIAVYFILWAVIHSILASLTVKSWASKVLGEGVLRWYRLFFVSSAVITLIPLLVIYYLLPDKVIYQISPPWRWLMLAGQGLSALALGIATWKSGLFQFIGLSQALTDPQHFTGNLVTSGIFRYVRHPLYLFSSLFLWLTPTMTQNQRVLYWLMTLYFVVGSVHEEQILADEFGDAYVEYKAQVPRFFPIPGRFYRG